MAEEQARRKISIGQTVGHAYSFAVSNYLTVLQLIWLPLVLIHVAVYFMLPALVDLNAGLAAHDTATMVHEFPQLFALYVLISLLFVMQFASVLPHALGLKSDVPLFSFPLGKSYWRLVLASFIVALISFALMLIVVVLGGLLGAIIAASTGATKGASPEDMAQTIARYTKPIVETLIYAGLAVIAARQVFLLAPTIVAEGRLGLGRAWRLGRGNFWRIIAVIVGIAVPFAFLDIIYLKFMMPGLTSTANEAEVLTESTHALLRIQSYWYIFYPVSIVISVFLVGLISGAQSFAYRALALTEKVEDVF